MLMERLPESFISNSYALHADKQRQFLCRLALDAIVRLIFFFFFFLIEILPLPPSFFVSL